MREHTENIVIEEGHFARVVAARVRPNQDITEAIEEICRQQHIKNAVVRGCVGSLMDANLMIGSGENARVCHVAGPGLEIAVTAGEVRPDDNGELIARLHGFVATSEGQSFAGEFQRGRNLSFVTLELILQEWLPTKP
jgi:uncharacterized protein